LEADEVRNFVERLDEQKLDNRQEIVDKKHKKNFLKSKKSKKAKSLLLRK